MDWAKAKTILIILLILTNIILVTVFIYDQVNVSKSFEVTLQTINQLQKSNIEVTAEIPKKIKKMPVLYVQYNSDPNDIIDREIAAQSFDEKNGKSTEGAIKIADKFLKKCDLQTRHVKLQSSTEEDGKFFVNYVNITKEGVQIEESYLLCIISDGKVEAIKRYWLLTLGNGKTKKEIMPATSALMQFMNEEATGYNIVISGIDIVYWLDTSYVSTEETKSDTALPTWRITYNGGREKFIPAFEAV